MSIDGPPPDKRRDGRDADDDDDDDDDENAVPMGFTRGGPEDHIKMTSVEDGKTTGDHRSSCADDSPRGP